MTTEIVSREQVGTVYPITWMVATDHSGLGLEDCGCGKKIDGKLTKIRGPVIEVIFYHPRDEHCMMGFKRGDDFAPLCYEDYVALFPVVEGEDDVDEHDGSI